MSKKENKIQHMLNSVKTLIKAGRRIEAEPLIWDILAKDKTNIDALFFVACIYPSRPDEIEALNLVLENDPNNRIALSWLDNIQNCTTKIPPILSRLGEYRLVEKIGAGTAIVYKAVNLAGKEFAIKILPQFVDPDFDKTLEQEVLITKKLHHPQIIDIIGKFVDVDLGTTYIVMEYVRGHTLQEEIKDISIPEAIDIVKQCCEVLNYCHEQHVYHRDIKPSNIMITIDKEGKKTVKLLDFGLATVIRSSLHKQKSKLSIVGTLHYRPPEQIFEPEKFLKARPDFMNHTTRRLEAIDIYELGVVFYQLLTKVLPFNGENASQIIKSITEKSPVPPRKRNQNVSPALSRLVMSMLARKPYERPVSKQLLKSLEYIEDGADWLSSLTLFTNNLLMMTLEVVIATLISVFTYKLDFSLTTQFVIFSFFVVLLGGSFIFFLVLWNKGVRNSTQLLSSGAVALMCILALSAFFFSIASNEANLTLQNIFTFPAIKLQNINSTPIPKNPRYCPPKIVPVRNRKIW